MKPKKLNANTTFSPESNYVTFLDVVTFMIPITTTVQNLGSRVAYPYLFSHVSKNSFDVCVMVRKAKWWGSSSRPSSLSLVLKSSNCCCYCSVSVSLSLLESQLSGFAGVIYAELCTLFKNWINTSKNNVGQTNFFWYLSCLKVTTFGIVT